MMTKTMRAVGSTRRDPDNASDTLEDIELPLPSLEPCDVLVRVRAASVNPLDVRLAGRQKASPAAPKVLGWDASGTIEAIGEAVEGFAVGDAVFYVGDIRRQGCNAEFQAVDSRLIAPIPKTRSFVEAAALPLAGLTAWGMLFDQFGLDQTARGDLLIYGGAGGVATLAVLLAKARTDVTIIGTASRSNSREWLKRIGAHHIVTHSEPLPPQIGALSAEGIEYIFSMHTGAEQFSEFIQIATLRGKIGFVDTATSINLAGLRDKNLSIHAEGMWATLLQGSPDRAQHRHILDQIARLCEREGIPDIVTRRLKGLSTETVRQAHREIATGTMIGKLVIEFD